MSRDLALERSKEQQRKIKAENDMTTHSNGGPAFPHDDRAQYHERAGMTLRDYFAAKAMQAEMADPAWHIQAEDWTIEIAQVAYRMADAMIKARETP